jgi:hypothetical protein
MSVSTPPPPAPKKKSGLGCLGCGCLVLALLAILFVALVGGGGYMVYQKVLNLTSPTAATIPSFNGTDDVYNAAKQKVSAFQYDVANHQPATIQLSADEINTLITRNPDLIQQQARYFFTLTNDQAEVQGSIPTDTFTAGLFKGRYFNFDTTFGLGFNSDSKNIDLMLHHLQIGDQTTPQNLLPTVQAELAPLLNMEMQKNEMTKNLLLQAKSIQVKDGQLVIETQ